MICLRLTVKHDFSCSALPDLHVGGAVGHGSLLRGVAFVQSGCVDLEHVGRPEDQVEALVAGDATGVVDQDDVVPDAAVADPPDGDGVEEDRERGVGNGGIARHDGLGHILPLESGREIAQTMDEI